MTTRCCFCKHYLPNHTGIGAGKILDTQGWCSARGFEIRDALGDVTCHKYAARPEPSPKLEAATNPPDPDRASVSALDIQVGGDHYKKQKIQPIEYIHANGIGFFEGNVIKYVTRWKDKAGIKDLEKAKHYLEMLIEFETKKLEAK